jgi:hypothetical protein
MEAGHPRAVYALTGLAFVDGRVAGIQAMAAANGGKTIFPAMPHGF